MRSAGFVLTGGESSRMGRDKAMLSWRSRPLVESVVEAVKSAARNVTLIGAPERYAHLGHRVLADLRPGMGPLGGIHTALKTQSGELNLIVACDMPGLSGTLLTNLLRAATQNNALCTVTRDGGGGIHPLCAVYRTECLSFIEDALKERRLRLLDLVRDLRAVSMYWDGNVSNVNTPVEWERWQQHD